MIRRSISVVPQYGIVKEVGKEIIFLLHHGSFACHPSEELPIIQIEIMTLSKVFKGIGHPVSAAKVFFVSRGVSDRF